MSPSRNAVPGRLDQLPITRFPERTTRCETDDVYSQQLLTLTCECLRGTLTGESFHFPTEAF